MTDFGTCLVCGGPIPDGEGEEILEKRVEHMKGHGYDFSYLLSRNHTLPRGTKR